MSRTSSRISRDESTVAGFVASAIERSAKTQAEISEAAKFPTINYLSMIKTKATKLPISRIVDLAKALEVSPARLLRLVLNEYQPELAEAVFEYLTPELTEGEWQVLDIIRDVTGNKKLKLSSTKLEKIRESLESVLR